MEKNRFKQLLESTMGNVKPLITEDDDLSPECEPSDHTDRIQSLYIDKNGVATLVTEKYKNVSGHRSNNVPVTHKNGVNGTTLSIPSVCQKFDDQNKRIPVTYKRSGENLILPEGCIATLKAGGDDNTKKPAYTRLNFRMTYTCDSVKCIVTPDCYKEPTKQPNQPQDIVDPLPM